MIDRKPAIAILSHTKDLAAYEQECRQARDIGAIYVACSAQAEPTRSMWADPKDSYCRYFVNSPSVFKFAEAGVVRGVYSPEHIAANADLLARRGEILARLGLKGAWHGLELMWLSEEFFAAHPHLRGPRVDHPARSLTQRFAPCVDQPEILEAYALAVERICRLAPTLELFEFYTNDAGAGICWCEFLYPGQNGPAACKHRPMGDRLAGFFSAFLDGGRRAGRDLTVLLRPKHFSEPETADYQAKLPRGAGMNYRIYPTRFHDPFADQLSPLHATPPAPVPNKSKVNLGNLPPAPSAPWSLRPFVPSCLRASEPYMIPPTRE